MEDVLLLIAGLNEVIDKDFLPDNINEDGHKRYIKKVYDDNDNIIGLKIEVETPLTYFIIEYEWNGYHKYFTYKDYTR